MKNFKKVISIALSLAILLSLLTFNTVSVSAEIKAYTTIGTSSAPTTPIMRTVPGTRSELADGGALDFNTNSIAGITSEQTNMVLSSVQGLTSASGDYAIKLEAKTTDAFALNGYATVANYSLLYQNYTDAGNNYTWRDRVHVIEFDVKADTACDSLGLVGWWFWGTQEDYPDCSLLCSDGTIRGTKTEENSAGIAYPVGKWFNLKFVCDFTTSQAVWTGYITVDDVQTTLFENVNAEISDWHYGSRDITSGFAIAQSADKEADAVKAGFAIDNYHHYEAVETTENVLTSPARNEGDAYAPIEFSIAAKGGDTIKFYLDDKLMEEFNVTDKETLTTYKTNLVLKDSTLGYKNFKAVKDTGSTEEVIINEEIYITDKYKGAFRINNHNGSNGWLSDYSLLPTTVAPFEDASLNTGNSPHFAGSDFQNGHTSNDYGYWSGVSEDDLDGSTNKALFGLIANNTIVNTDWIPGFYLVYSNTGKLYTAYNNSVLEFEFDIMPNSTKAAIGLYGPKLWHNESLYGKTGYFIMYDGMILGANTDADATYKANEWTHMKLSYDISQNIWNVWKGKNYEEHVVKNAVGLEGSPYNKNDVYNILLTITPTEAVALDQSKFNNRYYGMNVGLDNYSATRQYAMPKITSRSYNDNVAATNMIPDDAASIQFTFDKAYEVLEAKDVALKVGNITYTGETLEGFNYNKAAKTVSVNLPNGLSAGDKVEVKILGTAKMNDRTTILADEATAYDDATKTAEAVETGKALAASFTVYESGFELRDFTVADGKASINVYNGTGSDVEGVLVIAGYNEDNELVALSYNSDYVASASKLSNVKTVDVAAAASYKVMFWEADTYKPHTVSAKYPR